MTAETGCADPEMTALRKQLYCKRREIIKQTQEVMEVVRVPMTPDADWIIPTALNTPEWTETPGRNVRAVACSLQSYAVDTTILNVKCDKEALISPHEHDRPERVFVLEGEYTDMVSGITYKAGETQYVPAHQQHGLVSDGALLVVTWQPPFDYEKINITS